MIRYFGYFLEVRGMGLRGSVVSVVPSLFLCAAVTCFGQTSGSGQVSGDWPMVGHDAGSTRYSPLTQVTVDNVSQLKRAWTFHMTPAGEAAAPAGGRGRALP